MNKNPIITKEILEEVRLFREEVENQMKDWEVKNNFKIEETNKELRNGFL